MFAKSILAVAVMAGAVVAQTTSASTTAAATSAAATTGSASPSIVTSAIAAEVSGALKASWCNSQQNVCLKLCGGSDSDTASNSCTPDNLSFDCRCASNNSAPGLQYYKDTIDYNVCQQAYADCINANPNNQEGQDGCTTNIRDTCGTLDVANYTAGAASSATPTSAASTSSAATSTAAGTAAATTSPSSAMVGKEMGLGIFSAAMLAAFGFLL